LRKEIGNLRIEEMGLWKIVEIRANMGLIWEEYGKNMGRIWEEYGINMGRIWE